MEEPVESVLPFTSTLTDDPSIVAVRIRAALNIPPNIHTRWPDPYTALRGWRAIVESLNILVFNSDFPRAEAQGFSLSDTQPNVIMLSAKDPPTARCFTLWHEVGHLLLRDTGLCVTDEPEDEGLDDDRRTEDWCHRFAEAMLVDGELLKSRSQASAVTSGRTGYESDLLTLANQFKVSQHVVLFRMRHLEMLPNDRFWWEFNRVRQEQAQEAQRESPNRGGGRNVPNEIVRNSGQRLARILLQALDRGTLTRADIADYLGARLKHIDNIRREAHR